MSCDGLSVGACGSDDGRLDKKTAPENEVSVREEHEKGTAWVRARAKKAERRGGQVGAGDTKPVTFDC